jgi:hypothetical protein
MWTLLLFALLRPHWDAIALCESAGHWHVNNGNGFWGGLQFHPATWHGFGGRRFSGRGPFPPLPEEQIAIAERVFRRQGPSAWPHCFR